MVAADQRVGQDRVKGLVVGVSGIFVAMILFLATHAQVSVVHSEVSVSADDLVRVVSLFLALSIAGVALAAVRGLRVAWVPAVAHAVAPVFLSRPGCLDGGKPGSGSLVAVALPPGASVTSGCAWHGAAGLGWVLFDLVLVMIPAVLVVLLVKNRSSRHRGVPATAGGAVATAILGLATGSLVLMLQPSSGLGSLPTWLPLFLFGALLGSRWTEWSWTLLAVPLLWDHEGVGVIGCVAAVALGSVADRLSALLSRPGSRSAGVASEEVAV